MHHSIIPPLQYSSLLNVRVSRSQNLNPLGSLHVTCKTILGLLAIQGDRRKFRHAPFLDFGDDEMMSGAGQALSHRAFEFLQRCNDAGLWYTSTARYSGQIGLTGRG